MFHDTEERATLADDSIMGWMVKDRDSPLARESLG